MLKQRYFLTKNSVICHFLLSEWSKGGKVRNRNFGCEIFFAVTFRRGRMIHINKKASTQWNILLRKIVLCAKYKLSQMNFAVQFLWIMQTFRSIHKTVWNKITSTFPTSSLYLILNNHFYIRTSVQIIVQNWKQPKRQTNSKKKKMFIHSFKSNLGIKSIT